MNENKFKELINKEIDDLISFEEKTKLHEYLEKYPEAMKEYQNLVQSVKILDKIEEIEPPEGMKSKIINSIDLNRYAFKQKKKRNFNLTLFDWLYYPKPKLAFSFATGTTFGLLAYALFFSNLIQKNPIEHSELTGTIGISKISGIEKIDIIPISIEKVLGEVVIKRHNRLVWFEIKLETENKIEIILEFEKNSFNFENYNNDLDIQAGADYVKTTVEMNKNFILFLLKRSEPIATIDLKMFLSGELRFFQKIDID